ncbi:hypothetical protein BASA81_005345 [Batrachochytrium salamandrivorans]|nr:hypothetical protein BASA81_005345 [Batrachochytrium salamandrivorans]
MDAADTLRLANQALRSELVELERQIQALRDSESVGADELLVLENQLLRAQLKEQQEFLEGCQVLMRSIPELSSSSSCVSPATAQPNQAELLQQGSDNTSTLLHLLVSRCQSRSSEWRPVTLPTHLFHSKAIPGFNVTSNFQRDQPSPSSSTRMYLRVDGCFPNVPPQVVADGYWNTWVDETAFNKTLESFISKPIEHMLVPFLFRELMTSPPCFADGGEETKVSLYRELHPGNHRDWIYCLTRKRQEVALSTLQMPAELNPTVTTRRDQHTRRVVGGQGEFCPRKRTKGCASVSQLVGKRECIVLAKSCMKQLVPGGGDEAGESHVVSKHAIAADGLFVWQDEVSIDFEVECAGGEVEIQRKRVPAARAISFVSLVSDASPIQDLAMYSNVVDSMGRATERYAKLVDIFYEMMTGGVGDGTAG